MNERDDQKTDGPAAEARLDAVMHEFERIHREARPVAPAGSSNRDMESGEVSATTSPEAAVSPTSGIQASADAGSEAVSVDANAVAEPPAEADWSLSGANPTDSDDLGTHSRSDIGEDDDDLFVPESSAEVGVADRSKPDDPALRADLRSEPAQSAPGLAMAMSAAAVAGAVTQANRRRWFGLRNEADARAPRPEPDLRTEVSAAPAPEAAAPVARKGWFRFRKSSDAKSDPFAAMTEAIAPRPKGERKGWSGSHPAPEPIPEAAAPEMVDLEPVREALKSAALGRFETSTLDVATADAAAGALGKAPAVGFADAAPVGVLLVNLGAPDAPKAWAVRRYLRQFLSDRRVIEKDTFAWQLRLRSAILPVQSRRSARAYRSIWNHEANESPLKTITRSQADQLGKALAFGGGGDVTVDWVMRYGNPSIESRIKALIAEGCDRVVLVPLYPQYSSTTTATACDEAFRVLMRLRNQPSLRVAPPYYSDPVYVEAIASSISDHLAKLTFEPEVILASYHGLPQDYVEKGDPYLDQCKRTTELLRERLGLPEGKLVMTFQSRFGRTKWLRPYTDEILRRLAKSGIRNVAVVTPGFATDCVETLEEIAIENARGFKKRGGNNFALIPCLNDTERGMQVIREIALRELKGWV